jgi:hypothetical protein
MGLKGYRLWVMGQLDSTCSAPPMPFCCITTAESLMPKQKKTATVSAKAYDPG